MLHPHGGTTQLAIALDIDVSSPALSAAKTAGDNFTLHLSVPPASVSDAVSSWGAPS